MLCQTPSAVPIPTCSCCSNRARLSQTASDFGHEAPTALLIPPCPAKDLHRLSHLEKLSKKPKCRWVWANRRWHRAHPYYPMEPEMGSRPIPKNPQELSLQVSHNPLQSLDLFVLKKAATRQLLTFIPPKRFTAVHPTLRRDGERKGQRP